ncbi:helix-turn-helix domain-containing protein [Hominenteromicrobium sp.]|uniref:helix-turn-helix domain-containing protein n=1 Tax=Hominenteromicrobium sp. TaxID=3073581 RepID=UPI003A950F4D
MPVIEICGACGFNSLSRFYRLFTERYGCAPKAFRTQFAHAQSGQGSPTSLS